MKAKPRPRSGPPLRPSRRRWLALACGLPLALYAGGLAAEAETTDREVAQLLDRVRASRCAFVRNGKTHDARAAADHLAQKFRRGRRYVTTTEAFIDRLATRSSMSGEPYLIVCDGREEPTGAWLHRALKELRAPEAPG